MKLLLSLAFCAVGFAQTGQIPTAQLCVAPKIGSYEVTGKVGSFSLLKFICIDPPIPSCPKATLYYMGPQEIARSLDGLQIRIKNNFILAFVLLFKNGLLTTPFKDYTVAGNTINLSSPLLSSDVVQIFYLLPTDFPLVGN